MRLHYSPTSPYVRKVMVVLHETGLLEHIELQAAQASPINDKAAPVSFNPLGKVPVLERPDGPAIYDSRVITRYLDSLAGAGLYPDPPRLWDTLTIEATGDGIVDAALLITYEARLRGADARSEAFVDGQWRKVARALSALEEKWMSHLHGKFDIGQVSVGCALAYLDFRHGDRNWREGRPLLASWYDDFATKTSMQDTVPVDG